MKQLKYQSSAKLTCSLAQGRTKSFVPKRRILRKRNNGYPGFHAWGTVLFLLLISIPVGYIGYKSKLVEKAESKMTVYAEEYQQEASKSAELTKQNDALIKQLQFSSKIVVSDQTKNISIYFIHKYFPPSVWDKVQKVMTCESGLSNLALNDKNTNGSSDTGLYQINSVHAKQFKVITGVDYATGAYDWDASSKFAGWLFKTQGFIPWVCRYVLPEYKK